jgi:hypothetical protein
MIIFLGYIDAEQGMKAVYGVEGAMIVYVDCRGVASG